MKPKHLAQQKTLRQALLLIAISFSLLTVAYSESKPQARTAPPSPATANSADERGPESLHIIVGHSTVIHTASRVKRILTGNPAVVESVLTSPQELVVTAKQPGGSSLMLWQEMGGSRMLDIFADLDVVALRNAFNESCKSLRPRTSSRSC